LSWPAAPAAPAPMGSASSFYVDLYVVSNTS
jgi:hypothetical protein